MPMLNRRTFIAGVAAAVTLFRSTIKAAFQPIAQPGGESDCEYIVVGSGAGGGTLAARLAELGHKVLLLEAGRDPKAPAAGSALPEDYDVPAFHANSTENSAMKWDFFVRHYSDTDRQKRDGKYRETYEGDPVDGVLYPRAGTLGGCTAHNAMILVCPHNDDWQQIADATEDPSWAPANMRKYFEKLENCHHRPLSRLLKSITGLNPSRHGFGGWLRTEKAVPVDTILGDRDLIKTIKKSVAVATQESSDQFAQRRLDFETLLDPNDWRVANTGAVGVHYTPLTTSNHARTGPRERLMDVQARNPRKLRIEKDALATKVLFDDQKRAIGVEYRKGRGLYRPHGQPLEQGETKIARASREVILCGGAFNTPQLLMLSGIGPKTELERWGIQPVKILEGVGKNLQDRYEIGVVHRLKKDWHALAGATFTKDDPQFRAWKDHRSGVYTSNGAMLAVTRKSAKATIPDLFCFGLLGNFHGYYPGYSKLFAEQHDRLTWAILKGHTLNRGGEVTLKSADPLIAPAVNFHYFDEGTDKSGQDLDSVVEGIQFVRKLTGGLSFMQEEEIPGPAVESVEQLREFVRNNAWGHHASCSCKIGKDESDNSVLDSHFRVFGVTGLRVVDASIFPRIPGFFIVSSIYIAAEKAADVIHSGN